MNREYVEKLESNPARAASYHAHLAKAEALHGEGSFDAQSYAATAADLEVAETEQAESARAQREAEIIADHNARQAVEAAQPSPAPAPSVDPTDRAKAGWAKAIGEINAIVRDQPKPAQGEPAHSAAAVLDEQDQPKPVPPPAGRSDWAKAAAAANAERGV